MPVGSSLHGMRRAWSLARIHKVTRMTDAHDRVLESNAVEVVCMLLLCCISNGFTGRVRTGTVVGTKAGRAVEAMRASLSAVAQRQRAGGTCARPCHRLGFFAFEG